MKILPLLVLLMLETIVSAQHAVNLRIINGTKATDTHQWEWILSLRQHGEHICGASLIAPQWAVTAAHCVSTDDGVVSASSLSVMAGSYNVYSQDTVISVKKVVRHPQYSDVSIDNDIALLKLASAVSDITPVTLAQNAPLLEHDPSFVAGWGNMSTTTLEFPSELMQVDLKIIDFAQCSKSYRTEEIYLTDNMFCAGYMDGSKDSCQGDSGGPLIIPQGNYYELAGIVSFGGSETQMCGAPNFPGIYTKVQNYVAWIEGYTGILKRHISLEETLKTREFYTIDGTFSWHDFENVPNAFDWVYQMQNGRMFQLQGKQATDNDVFGWKEVYGLTITPQWQMIYLGSDIDGDGTTKFDWIVLGMHTNAAYKLEGVRENGTFKYSDKLDIHYDATAQTVRFY